MLKAENIRFRYAGTPWILEDVCLTIRPGEVVGLPGPSGRGKSTLAKVLAGHLFPQQGTVTLDGDPLPERGYCPAQLIFQHPELAMNPRWTGAAIVAEDQPPDPALLEALNINPQWLSRYPHELSGGELQRLALARAMTPGTRYLIADEMTAMLDPNTQALIWEATLAWAGKNNVGILAVSHDLPLLARVADRLETMFQDEVAPNRTATAA